MSPTTRPALRPVSAHATDSRNSLRLLTLAAVMLVILFKTPSTETKPIETIVASASQASEERTTE